MTIQTKYNIGDWVLLDDDTVVKIWKIIMEKDVKTIYLSKTKAECKHSYDENIICRMVEEK